MNLWNVKVIAYSLGNEDGLVFMEGYLTKSVIDIISLLRSFQASPSLQLSRRLNMMAVPWSIAFSLRIPVLTRKLPLVFDTGMGNPAG